MVERDYAAVADKWAALGPLVDTLGLTTKGVTTHPDAEVAELARQVRGDEFRCRRKDARRSRRRSGWPM